MRRPVGTARVVATIMKIQLALAPANPKRQVEGVTGPMTSLAETVKLLELAWGIIANAQGGDWEKATPEWKAAAERWRDRYYKTIPATSETPDVP